MRRVFAAVVTAIAACFLAAPAAASFPGANGLIVYTGPLGNLYVVEEGSDTPQVITDFQAFDPVFNATGTKIAFTGQTPREEIDDPGCDPFNEECKGENELYLMNPDGSGLEALTHTRVGEFLPSWSPDGTKLLYSDNNTLKILTIESGDVTTLLEPGYNADWSPAGDLIAFERADEGENQGSGIWVVEPDGENARRLTAPSPAVYPTGASWAPDGSRIAFQRFGPPGSIHTIPADSVNGSGEQLVATGTYTRLAWSPDGESIAFTREDQTFDLMTAPATGGAATVMPVSTATGFDVEFMGGWQPLTVLQSVEEEAEAAETVSTGADATPEQPLQTSVTTPNAGAVSIQRIAPVTPLPLGFGLLGSEFRIEAPSASVADPLAITFLLDASAVPAGETHETIELLRDGEPVPACTGIPGQASPDPCVSARALLGGGDVSITALSSHASAWNVATLDDEAPETTITSGPSGQTRKRTPTFGFSSSEDESSFECRVDSAPFKPCDSPSKTKRLSLGRHKFQVVASDAAQNKDETPAKRSFRVVR